MGAAPGSDFPPDGARFDSFFEASGAGRGLALSCHGSTELSPRVSGPDEAFAVEALSEATAGSPSSRSSTVSTTVTRAKTRAKAIRIKPTLMSGSLPNPRLPLGNLKLALR
jgi:hypothetical protein